MKKIKILTNITTYKRSGLVLGLMAVVFALVLTVFPAQKSYADAPATPATTTTCGSSVTGPGNNEGDIGDTCIGVCPEGQRAQLTNNANGDTICVVVANNNKCGNEASGHVVTVSFNFGCRGNSYTKGPLNPILDIAYAIFRFLSAGVGIIVIGSIIVAGIQYSASRGNPQGTELAIKRITNSIIGLLIYIFMFAILNFIVPGGMFI